MSISECPKCGNLIEDGEVCSCGASQQHQAVAPISAKATYAEPQKKVKPTRVQLTKGSLLRICGAVSLAIIIFLGNYHVVRGSTYTGGLFVPRLSFGYSEMWINTDQLLNMPVIVAKSKYPLSVAALQKSGFIETDQARENRVKAEIDEEIKRSLGNPRSVEDQLYKLNHGHYPDEK